MARSTPAALVLGGALIATSLLAGCSIPASQPAGPTSSVALRPTLEPAFGLTWTMAPAVELPGDAFAIPSNPATGPANPGTAGHPGHFPGQSIIADVAVSGSRLVAIGYVGLGGSWHALAWTSEDGLAWTVRDLDPRPGSFAVAVTVAAGGSFVAVGRVGREAAAWRTPDGVVWSPAVVAGSGGEAAGGGADRPPELAERMTAIVATPLGLVAGGSVGPELGARRARLWRSTDGAAWRPVADEDAFDGGEIRALATLPTGLVALGRLGTGQRSTGSVAWRSTDAGSWTRIDDPALAGGLVAAVAVTDGRLLAVGSDLDEREAVAWSSSDGTTWARAPSEAARLHVGEKIRMTDVVSTPAGFVAVGNYVGVQFGTGTSWLSRDGVSWSQAPDQPTLGQAEPEAVVTWGQRLVIVGSRGAPDNYIPSIWISPGLP
jgi:hypothetical protein